MTNVQPLAIDEDILAASTMVALGAVGFTCIVYSMSEIRRNKSLHNAFGVLAHGLRDSRLDQEVSAVISFFYVTTTYAHIFKGLNRLAAVYMPSAYRWMFSIKGTLKLVAFGLLLCVGHNLPYHIRGCHGYYDADTWSFMYAFSDCAQYVAYYDDFYFTIGSAAFVLVIDVAVFVRLRMLSRSLQQKQSIAGMSASRFRQETRYFFQACTTSVLLTALLLSWLLVAPIAATTKWSAFFFYTLNAELYHVVDGMALCLFGSHSSQENRKCVSSIAFQRAADALPHSDFGMSSVPPFPNGATLVHASLLCGNFLRRKRPSPRVPSIHYTVRRTSRLN
ncbi:CRE-SRX-12 protein [Aphelenchoides avenae]|nr:CRE-SRX-12 protein [Aphelenchus avenae]